jgi:heme exporter protein D
MYVLRNIGARSCKYFRRKAIIITYSEYVFVALVIQHALRMRRIILQSVARPAARITALSHKQHDCKKILT